MLAKSLRELQQKGEKAVGKDPMVLTNRRGPVGILIPVTSETLPYIEREVQKMSAQQSLRKTWATAREHGLDRLSQDEIEQEVVAVRKKRNAK
jgi:hypothetical protein